MSMFNKLKNTLSNIREEDRQHETHKRNIDISFLSLEEIKIYKKILEGFKENIDAIDQIAKNNKEGLKGYIEERAKEAAEKQDQQPAGDTEEGENEKYTFDDDMKEIKDALN